MNTSAASSTDTLRRRWRDVVVALYVSTQQDLKSGHERMKAERQLQRALEDIERAISPRPPVRFHNQEALIQGIPCSCPMCYLLREYDRHELAMQGSQTQSYGETTTLNDGSGREFQALAPPRKGGARSSPVEASIDAIARIESLLESMFYRGNMTRLLERHGLAHNLKLDRCRVCDDSRLREINTLLLVDAISLRECEAWTAETGERISRETLRRHLQHKRTA